MIEYQVISPELFDMRLDGQLEINSNLACYKSSNIINKYLLFPPLDFINNSMNFDIIITKRNEFQAYL